MTSDEGLSDADAQYLLKVADDCKASLGSGIALLDLRHESADDGVRLIARCRLEKREWESVGIGENLVAAHSVLRARLLFDRIRFGFATLVDRG